MSRGCILAVDEGTTNSKAVLVSEAGKVVAAGSCPVETGFPEPGWAEQDAVQIWSSTVAAISACLEAGSAGAIEAIGISNQRESVLIWSRDTGQPMGPVITWQCRRTAPDCDRLRGEGHEDMVVARTGLPLDPLFPATKIRWLLDTHCQGVPAKDLCVGTIDSWLIWNFTGGTVHATDASNASRTQLYNLATGTWDLDLCALFGVDPALLPKVCDSSHIFGKTKGVDGLPDGIPIASAIGDSHGALFGHGAFKPGDGKVTFGTGSSVMTAVQDFIVPPKGITTTVAWQLAGTPTFAFEGNILVSASILPWTADLLGLEDVDALMHLARTVDDTLGVHVVPAHVGLGSPHWNAEARGLIDGLTFAAGPAHIAHAAVLSIALQVADVFDIIRNNSHSDIGKLSADGGPSQNTFLMQMVANHLDQTVTTRDSTEASALGAAYLAGLAVGFWPDLGAIADLDRPGRTLTPNFDNAHRAKIHNAWRQAIARSVLGTS